MTNKRLIVVLGMHRSGSSAITRGLEVMGVNLGSHLMSADVYNEKGYFEDVELNQLNIEILKAIGHSWSSLSLDLANELRKESLRSLKDHAVDLLKKKLADTNVLGIKDPRLCRLLPFWKEVFNELKLDVSYVIILRNPESIAASLFARDAYPRVKALYLWLEHMVPVFRETRACKRYLVDFEKLVARPREVIKTLANDLNLSKQLNQDSLNAYERDFIDTSLNHHQTDSDTDNNFTPRLITQLHDLLNDATEKKISIDSAEFMAEINEIEKELKDKADLLSYIDTLDSIILRSHFNLTNIDANLKSLSASYDQTKGTLESKKKIIKKRNLQVKKLKTDVANRDELLASLEHSMIDRDSKIEALEITISGLKSTIGLLEQSLADRDLKIDSLEQSLADRDLKIDSLGASLNAQKAKISTYINQINSLNQQIELNVSDIESVMAQLEEIQSGLFWRFSTVSRRFWHYFDLALASKIEKFHLIPLNELKRVRALNNSWMSTGLDPHFRLVPRSGRMPGGWTRIRTSIQSGSREFEFKLYLDCGDGFSEEKATIIPVSLQGEVNEIIHLPESLKTIRWDPIQCKGEFRQLPIVFSRVSWLSRKLHMINRVINVLINAPSETKKDHGLAWKLIVSDLNQAYEATRPAIIFQNLHNQNKAKAE